MIKEIMLEATKLLTKDRLFSPFRCITYIAAMVGIIWLSAANYHYFANNHSQALGALASAILCFITAIITEIIESFSKEKVNKQNSVAQLPAVLVSMLPSVTSMLAPKALDIVKDLYQYYRRAKLRNKLTFIALLVIASRLYRK